MSRWELGTAPVPYDAVIGYETLLELPPHSLSSVFDTVLRYHAPTVRAGLPLARSHPAERIAWPRTEGLLRQAAQGAPMNGSGWDELTALVTHGPRFSYGTDDLWAAAAHRLLTEVMVADGVSWMRRFEAFNRLLAHPVLQIEALAAVRDAVADRTVQSLVGTACMFDSCAHAEATTQVLRQLRSPGDDRVFKGSLMACVRKIDYGHFTPHHLSTLSHSLADVLSGGAGDIGPDGLGEDTLALARSVLRQIPPRLQHRQAAKLLRAFATRDLERHHAVVKENRLAPEAGARIVARRLAHETAARLSTPADGYVDDVLPVLFEETLFHPVFDVRLYAASLLHASPYRTAAARVLAEELTSTWRAGEEMWLTTLLEALRKLGGDHERRSVEPLVLHPSAPAAIADVAAYALGHIGGTSPHRFWQRAVTRHATAWVATRRPAHASVLDRLVYAIGRAGHRGLLAEVRDDPRLPAPVRSSARWWLRHPGVQD
ncbi:hypothetical protein ACL02U_22990 [Streptomyces sp. MS06]|uniref:hypothetical protein n=1 Tax=Streptomyces sp. MS06 TaxID=3385974 RepID=UPI0039A2E74F